MRRIAKIFGALLLAALAAPFLLLHLAVAYWGGPPRIPSATAEDRLLPGGGSVRTYAATAPDAAYDLVLIHGTPGDAGVFSRQFAQPPPAANLLAYDRPGFGASAGGSERPSLDQQVAVLAALLPAQPPRPVILVGHSYGAPVALLAALQHPERVAGVLLVGGAVDPALEEVYFLQTFGETFPFVRFLPAMIRLTNRELLTLRADLETLAALLPRLARPVLMLHGDQDREVPVANVAYLEGALARLGKSAWFDKQVLPGVNHYIPWTLPGELDGAVLRLRARVSKLR